MGSKPPQTRKGQRGFPFQTLPHEPETAGRKAAQVRLKGTINWDLAEVEKEKTNNITLDLKEVFG